MTVLIDTKTKREKLTPRREPYWSRVLKGGYVGFRKLQSGEGTWTARWRNDLGKQLHRGLENVRDYDAAVAAARAWFEHCMYGASPQIVTVANVCQGYVSALLAEGRMDTAKDAQGRFNRLVFDKPIGKLPLDKLRPPQLEAWLHKQIDADDDPDEVRRAKDSANRNLATFKAALNRALYQRLIASDAGWRTVKAFSKVAERRKDAFLSVDARRALMSASPAELQKLMKAALLTAGRPGELASLNVRDFDEGLQTLTLRGKTGERTVAISATAAHFLAEEVKGKASDSPILTTAYGQRWAKDSWKKPFSAAREAAQLPDAVVLYSLRHTAISELILNGMDVFIVAKFAGTSVEMIEKNYGHLRNSVVRDQLNKISML